MRSKPTPFHPNFFSLFIQKAPWWRMLCFDPIRTAITPLPNQWLITRTTSKLCDCKSIKYTVKENHLIIENITWKKLILFWIECNLVQRFIITKSFSMLPTSMRHKGNHSTCESLENSVIDTVGAGDAFCSTAALAAASNLPLELGTLMGQISGALAVRIVGNSKCVSKSNFLKSAESLLNR